MKHKYNTAVMTTEYSIETEVEERTAKQILAQGGHCHSPIDIDCNECVFLEVDTGSCLHDMDERVEVLKLMGVKL